MPIFTDNSATIGEQLMLRRPINLISAETGPNPQISRSSKSTISSLFLSSFSTEPTSTKKKSTGFRKLGCTAGAAQQVSVPAMIRSSAEWEGKRVKKKMNTRQQKRKKDNIRICSENGNKISLQIENGNSDNNGSFNGGNCMVVQDVWCGPGIGLSGDAVVGSVDCVLSRRNASGRGKIDGERIIQRERERERKRGSTLRRRAAINPETLSFLDSEPAFVASRPEPEQLLGSRYCRHIRHPSPDGLAEFMVLQNSFMMGGRMDRFSDWRLDIDHMSYEQLLELGERIGCVSTGLKEDEIGRCVRKIELSIINDLSSHLHIMLDKKCTICQEDYEGDDEVGKLECGHGFHIECIKQWLTHKNTCPVCKKEPAARG